MSAWSVTPNADATLTIRVGRRIVGNLKLYEGLTKAEIYDDVKWKLITGGVYPDEATLTSVLWDLIWRHKDGDGNGT